MNNNRGKADGHYILEIARMLRSNDEAHKAWDLLKGIGDIALAEILESATQDKKTGLSNQAMLEDDVLEIINSIDESGLIIVTDLVGFKKINDTYGQRVGDELLVAYANAIKSTIRTRIDESNSVADAVYQLESGNSDETNAFRIGGDEYALLLRNGVSLATANHQNIVRSKIIQSLQYPNLISLLNKNSIKEFGVRASFSFINPLEHGSFSDILGSIGAKKDSFCEYKLLSDKEGVYKIKRIL